MKWRRFASYSFAATEALAPLSAPELGRAALSMPLAFVEQQGRFLLVAVLSLAPHRNFFVAPDGRWLGGYVPAWFRGHPFRLASQQGTDQSVLCVEEDSALVPPDDPEGEAFFAEDGNVSPALRAMIDLLTEVDLGRKIADTAASILGEAGVIAPWPITMKTNRGDQAVSGLYRVDEAALNGLDGAAFLKLRRKGALSVAYAQILSAGLLHLLEQPARFHEVPAPPPAALPENLDTFFGIIRDDTIRF